MVARVAVGFAVLALLASLFWGRAHQQTLIAERQTRNAKQQTRIAEQQKQKAEEQTLLAQQQSRNSEARRLLTEATHITDDQPQEGLLLLVEAMNVHTRNRERPFVAVEQAFLTALTNFGGFALGGGDYANYLRHDWSGCPLACGGRLEWQHPALGLAVF